MKSALMSRFDFTQPANIFQVGQHRNTLFRWARHGHRGVRLKTFRCGRFAFTTRRKIEEFFADCTNAHDDGQADTEHDRDDEAALDELGV